MKKTMALVAIGAASALALSACSSGNGGSSQGSAVSLDYWMWDDQQVPLYQACAAAFTEANPNITVKITQTGWSQYWQNLNTQITAGTAPDIFVNQISYFREFADNQQLLDISEQVNASDIDFSDYTEGLADRWTEGSARYGLPKDWDTVALLYNVAAAEDAGFTTKDMASLTWNPTDGGTFGEFVRATSIDSAGRNGLDPAFDSGDVVRYGYYPEWADGAIGQNGWGVFAHSNGFTFGDGKSAPDYAGQSLVETAVWLQQLINDGYAPHFDETSTLGTQAVMENENATSTIQGSWMASAYLGDSAPVDFAFAPVPQGPVGRFASTNGLADSIWAGTKHPDEAYQFVAYLASADCQDKVGEAGLIFPALKSGTQVALKAREKLGYDSTAFVSVAEAGETFLVPVIQRSAEVGTAVQDAMQAIAQGADPKATLAAAAATVKSLYS
ncbi:sugar ABC transporter substrate-binding protein [Oerskovia sp. Root22]|uniref:ABC transporter substrate-binding protein n=1 Tax=Oerskovia sp. Root22 TaxID=1736494 RepID=UPI0006F7B1F2|nr:sugar ABC transporter substrate-binding protein [Oerskovia sp. Root22]KRC43027.1 sugar-binding protein [Oerskovia sp. Root22]